MEIGYFCGNPQQTADRALEQPWPGRGPFGIKFEWSSTVVSSCG